ncbi:MAG TPA: tetratricopeptide repeat protein, partial [Promineifilum sp.]|nr:tetratricopeptide repeat protein [Promineifilum sp.]
MRRPDKSFPFATPYLAGIAILGILLAGCGLAERSISTAGRSTNEATPALLPTPTLAAPVLLDPLRPPTPNVLPSPTSLPGATTAEPAPAEPIELPVVEPPPASPTPISLPEGATPEELLALGRRSADEGDQTTAAAAFRAVLDAPGALDDAQIAEARLGLAVALLADGQNSDAALELEALTAAPQDRAGVLGDRSSNGKLPVAQIAAFHLGRARAATGDHAGAIAAYETFLAANPDMAAYIQPLIADARAALGDDAGVVAALEGALDAPAQRFKAVANRSRLASLYLAQGDYTAAIAQYDAIHDIA